MTLFKGREGERMKIKNKKKGQINFGERVKETIGCYYSTNLARGFYGFLALVSHLFQYPIQSF